MSGMIWKPLTPLCVTFTFSLSFYLSKRRLVLAAGEKRNYKWRKTFFLFSFCLFCCEENSRMEICFRSFFLKLKSRRHRQKKKRKIGEKSFIQLVCFSGCMGMPRFTIFSNIFTKICIPLRVHTAEHSINVIMADMKQTAPIKRRASGKGKKIEQQTNVQKVLFEFRWEMNVYILCCSFLASLFFSLVSPVGYWQ